MAFFGTLTATLIAPAEEITTAEGVDAYEIKAVNASCTPGIPMLLIVDRKTDNGKFLKELSQLCKEDYKPRAMVTGVLQPVLAEKGDDKSIIKSPKILLYVGSARRIRADLGKDPEQAIVMGGGYCRVVTEFEDPDKRKAEVFLSAGTESVVDEGRYSSHLHVISDRDGGTDELFRNVEEGKEIYFVGSLFRSKGEMNGTEYDKLKVSATFAQETDRVQQRKGGGKRTKTKSMRSQLDSSFEDDEATVHTMSAEQLAEKTLVSLADF